MIETKMTGRLIAAARALVGVPQADFAAVAGLTLVELQHLDTRKNPRAFCAVMIH